MTQFVKILLKLKNNNKNSIFKQSTERWTRICKQGCSSASPHSVRSRLKELFVQKWKVAVDFLTFGVSEMKVNIKLEH